MSGSSSGRWLADRTFAFDSSGIRRVFELAASLKNPVNLSIGQPDFDVPEAVKEACIEAIRAGKNSYSLTQGIGPLREALEARVRQDYSHPDRKLLVTSGTSGALVLVMLSVVNPGDEVILFDPYFVMYKPLVELVGGRAVVIDTYPHFRVEIDRVLARVTPRTKVILCNSPSNPTGIVASREENRALAALADRQRILLVSDEIYHEFCYDAPFSSPAHYSENVLVIDGFSKSHAMTGWRLGFAHGPAEVVQAMIKLQQYSFVCAPHPVQWAALTALQTDVSEHVAAYQRKRDRLYEGLRTHYELARPDGAFYMFPRVPAGDCDDFVRRAMEHELLIVPGNIFSERKTHFRLSYAASDDTIERGIAILQKLASPA